MNEALREYLTRFYQFSEKVDIYNLRIEEFSRMPEYEQKVRSLFCMNGIATHTATCAIVEVRDFKRFSNMERLRRKFRNIASHLNCNIAKTAVARELACFIRGMMTKKYA